MPIKLDAKVCEKMGGEPITDDECRVTKEFIANLANKVTLTGHGQAYLQGLMSERIDDHDEQGIIFQGKYIASNCSTELPEEKEAWHILTHLHQGKPLPVYKEKENIVDEYELERLCTDITRKTENAPRNEEGKIPLKVFKDYAEMNDISLDKVLVCQDWVDEILSDEVIKAKEKAKKKVKIKWDD